ncbi:unnamed protein product [Adineta steineri]|uniref:Uncharacterized protein n=1 Tax=Adineta steineri TaxID=433720 RepID=A0A813PHL2_9BILA|nr:unnamed protein product [Adineta steineri]CAF3846572.1 unnamed protein product [Adineta steineri]
MNYNNGSTYGYEYQTSSYKQVTTFNRVGNGAHIGSNNNRFIDGQFNHPPQYLPHNGPSFPAGFNGSSALMPPSNFPQLGSNDLINDLERSTNMDINGDGLIGGQRSQPPQYQPNNGPPFRSEFNVYLAPKHPPNFPRRGSNDLINDLERSTNTDIDGDGLIGGQRSQSPHFYHSASGGQINQPQYPPNMNFNVDRNIMRPPVPLPNNAFNHPPPHPHHHGSGGIMNKLEKVTHIDFNRDGHIGD